MRTLIVYKIGKRKFNLGLAQDAPRMQICPGCPEHIQSCRPGRAQDADTLKVTGEEGDTPKRAIYWEKFGKQYVWSKKWERFLPFVCAHNWGRLIITEYSPVLTLCRWRPGRGRTRPGRDTDDPGHGGVDPGRGQANAPVHGAGCRWVLSTLWEGGPWVLFRAV